MVQNLTASSVSVGLPGRYYTDPEIFSQEMKTIWRSTWQMVGRVEDLPKPGSYLTRVLGEEPIVVVRLEDGALQAIHNVCPHRGARLVMDARGHCQHKIICPYHAWTFNLQGELLGVSQPKLFPDLDKSKIQLLKARVDTWGGFIFVNPDPEGEPLADYLAEMPQFLQQYDQRWEDMREIGRWHYDEPINWKLIVENYVETYHFPIAHARTLFPLVDSPEIPTLPTGRHLRYPIPYFYTNLNETLDQPARASKMCYESYVFPNLMINAGHTHVSLFYLYPLSPTQTRLEVIVYQTAQQFGQAPFTRSPLFDQVMEEDFSVCRQLQAGLHSRAYRVTQCAVNQEAGIIHFHQVLQNYSNPA